MHNALLPLLHVKYTPSPSFHFQHMQLADHLISLHTIHREQKSNGIGNFVLLFCFFVFVFVFAFILFFCLYSNASRALFLLNHKVCVVCVEEKGAKKVLLTKTKKRLR
jgi:hypothetical protein